jgi:zinc protease
VEAAFGKSYRMKIRILWLLALAAATSACLGVRGPPRFGDLRTEARPLEFRHDIRRYVINNGISVVLLPDPRTNLVTVDARYRVGASDDPAGRAGLAHLVEHLTFEARTETERVSLANRLGEAALQHNAFTNHDVTHYTATALSHRLADVLELEAQRLEMNCAQLDDAVFSRERDVVLEEIAERRTPWSELHLEVSRQVWGERHPYARGVGTQEVADATKDEACHFINSHYTPDRLMLVVTGDFDPDQVSHTIGKRFSRIPRKGGATQAPVQKVSLTGTRSRHQADIDGAVAIVFFSAPPWGSEEAVLHQLALRQLSQVLARADAEHSWLTDVSIGIHGAGRAQLTAVTLSVDDPERLDDAVDELFSRAPSMFEDLGPYQVASLLGRLHTGYVTSYESFLARGAWLADYLTYTQHNGFMVHELEALSNTTLTEANLYAQVRFSRTRSHVALVKPSGKPAAATRTAVASDQEPDLAPWRAPVDPLEATRPLPAPTRRVRGKVEELTLENGLRVLLAPDPTSALVDVRLVFPHGSASDPFNRRGQATAAATLLEYDPARRYRVSEWLLLKWGLSVGTQLDLDVYETSTVFKAWGSANRAEWHVWRMLWQIDQCIYPDEDVEKFRDDAVRDSADEAEPAEVLARERLFGTGHPYATPLAGDAWSWLTADELERYRLAYYVPRGATLIIAGGFEAEAMRKHVQTLFAPWSDAPVQPPATVPAAQPAVGPTWIGVRDPSRTQVGLEVAFATSSEPDRDQAARLVLGEMIEDRLRLVREGMGASYGVHASYSAGTGGGVFYVSSDLEPARAAKAAKAITSELQALSTGAGAMAEDFVRARRRALAFVLADAAGVTAVADELEYNVRRGLPVDHFDQLALAISKLTPAEVATVAAADLNRRHMVVSVTAPPEQLEALMTALGASEPRLFDKEQESEGKKKPRKK